MSKDRPKKGSASKTATRKTSTSKTATSKTSTKDATQLRVHPSRNPFVDAWRFTECGGAVTWLPIRPIGRPHSLAHVNVHHPGDAGGFVPGSTRTASGSPKTIEFKRTVNRVVYTYTGTLSSDEEVISGRRDPSCPARQGDASEKSPGRKGGRDGDWTATRPT